MTKDEAMKLALEALEGADWYINQLELIVYSVDDEGTHENRAKVQSAITAIKEALAQPEQEPVAWMFQHDETGRMNYVSNDGIHNPAMFLEMNPRYALVCPLYTTPPQRKPLTDEEISWIAINNPPMVHEFARAIEAAHGIKENT